VVKDEAFAVDDLEIVAVVGVDGPVAAGGELVRQ